MKKLNFGCGQDIKEGWVNVDVQKNAKIDKSFDFDKFPYPLKENEYEYILVSGVLEYLKKPSEVLNELWRISKSNAIIEIKKIPHYSNRSAYDDIDHIHYFSEIAFKHFVNKEFLIDKKKRFEIISLDVLPSNIGKWIRPKWLRERLSLLINGIQSEIYVKLRVIK